MKTISGKKKVQIQEIRISNYRPYEIVPLDLVKPHITFSNPDPKDEGPFIPCKVLPQDETHGTIRILAPGETPGEEMDPVEEVAAYLRKLEEQVINPKPENLEPLKKFPKESTPKVKEYKRKKN